MVPGHVTKFEVLRSSQQSTAGPAGQLVAVVLQLGGNGGPSLRIQLLTPVNAIRVPGVPLVEGLDAGEGHLPVGAGCGAAVLTADDEVSSPRFHLR